LSEARANELLIEFGPNVLPSDTKSSPFRTLASILREPMLLLLVGAGGISFILAERLDGILLISTVFIIVGISIFQERKTERALAALRELSSPQALVIRSGIRRRIPSSQLVPGDLIQLLEGDRVPADADLLDSKNLQLGESLLTGESIPVSKAKGERVFTGTLTVQGHGLAIVRETGSKSELGRIGHSLSKIDMKETRLQESISRIVRAIGIAALLTVSIVIVVYGLTLSQVLQLQWQSFRKNFQ
jgi:Ca2+-transporting ATPase